MSSFSAVDAAFSGFRVARERPLMVAVWAVLMTAVSLGSSLAMISLVGPELAAMTAASAAPDPDPQETLRHLAALGPFFAVLLPFSLLYYGVVQAAVNRAVLRPGDRAMASLRLGADEVRQVVVLLVQWLAILGVYLLAIIGVGVAIGVASATGGAKVAIPVGVLAGLAALATLIALIVRFSLAGAQTFDTGKINVFGTWRLTGKRFWPILGAYLLAFVMALIVWALVMAIILAAVVLLGGGLAAVGAIFQPDMSSLADFFTPAMIIYELLGGVMSALLLLISCAPAPTIYRALANDSTV